MSFQTPVTVQDVLAGIQKRQYLLPAIQREFVWDTDQIRSLFDSLLRGYPIGSFLFWQVEPETAKNYVFYDFITDYHQRDHPYAPKAHSPISSQVTAILDGQQRLTALNIGIYGGHAEKKKYRWWSSPDAFPVKRLYLNLLEDAEPGDLNLKYDLRFLTEEEAAHRDDEPNRWFRVRQALELANAGPAIHQELTTRGLVQEPMTFERLYRLFEALRTFQPINYYLEKSQETDKVLDIFVRVNSGGTKLSYSDLLLSMATNQWTVKDAREEVRGLVQQLNTGGPREFSFSKDNVLKAALMVGGVADLRFKVSNFTSTNMAKVEERWDLTKDSLLRTASLLDSFGLTSRALTAHSAAIPIAYYIAKRGLGDSYIDSPSFAADREQLRFWLIRSLVKRGVWGSGLDTLLAVLRGVIDRDGADAFPRSQLERAMAARGRGLAFDEAEIDEVLETQYASPRSFPVLSLLYPGLDYSKQFHEDHIYPKSRFTRKRLASAGIAEAEIEPYLEAFNKLPNLQLLAGAANVQKQDTMPADWLDSAYPSEQARGTYLRENDLADLPGLQGFMSFFEERRLSMKARLVAVLGPEVGADQ